jgi:NADH-quinone oxidoreductase subunit L
VDTSIIICSCVINRSVHSYVLFVKKTITEYTPTAAQSFFLNGWNFDKLYDIVLVKPFVWISNINKSDIVDQFIDLFGKLAGFIAKGVAYVQNGRINWYLTGIVAGLIIFITLMLYL